MTATRSTCSSSSASRPSPAASSAPGPVGVLDMKDDKGHDYKILAVANDDPRWDQTAALEDLSQHRLREIENFFQTYKALEDRETDVSGWLGIDDAWRIIDAAMAAGEHAAAHPGEGADPGMWR